MWYANPGRAHFKHVQSSALMLSGSPCACAFRLSCEVHVRLSPIPRSGLERDCRSLLEPFWRVRNFLSAMAMYAPQLVRMLYAFAGALPRPTLISRPFRQLTHCHRVHSVTVFCVSLMLNAKCKVHVMASQHRITVHPNGPSHVSQ